MDNIQTNRTMVYGIHAADKVIQYHPERILSASISISADSPRINSLKEKLAQLNVVVDLVSKEKMALQAHSQQHQGILLEIRALSVQNENDLFDVTETLTTGYFVALDTVEDPRNLGACIRTAESLGAMGVIIPKDKSASVTPVVRKVACGAAEILPIYQVTNLSRTLKTLQDYSYWTYGTGWSETSSCLYNTTFPQRFVIVMGSEGKGLRQLTAKTCDELLTIPKAGLTESLNVSVATGIICGEIMRQRQKSQSRL